MMKSKDCCMKRNKTNIFTVIHSRQKLEGYSELCQTSKMDYFKKKVNGFLAMTIFAKHSLLDF